MNGWPHPFPLTPLALGALGARPFGAPPRPFVWGHRGSGSGPTENTLLSFERALDAGADGVELDVRVCGTGEVVVVHDESLARVTEGRDKRLTAALAWRELAAVELRDGARIAKLDDVIDLANARGAALNVELKRDAPSRADVVLATARTLRRHAARCPLVVSSFDPAMLGLFAAAGPPCARALLIGPGPLGFALEQAASMVPVQLVHLERSLVTPTSVARHKARGRAVQAWTVNDVAEGVLHASSGVRGIITDRPGPMLQLLARVSR